MNFRKIILYIVVFISSLVILASLLSLFYNLPYWYSKVLDFPRLQYLILAVISLLLVIVLVRKWKWPAILLVSGLLSAIVIQSIRIFPYWFGDPSVPGITEAYSQDDSISILLANVLITNREEQKLFDVISESDPDVIVVMEVNQWWVEQLKPLRDNYPYEMLQPNDEAYGMALYSKLPLQEKQIAYLNHENVPSFHAFVQLASGKRLKLHAVHPVAPMPSSKYPDNVGEGEVALLKVGKMVAKEEQPAIVAGDFNDVSWSNTSRLFGQSGGLKNVRIGRGLYNSFDAQSKLMRWPLDHFFVTKEFKVAKLKRYGKIGSDHFPVYAELVLKD